MPLCHTLPLLLETEWLVQTKLLNISFENFLFLFKKDVQILRIEVIFSVLPWRIFGDTRAPADKAQTTA